MTAPSAVGDEYGTGFERWNAQAWLDFAMVKILMSRVSDVIPKTYVPILRLVSEEPKRVDDAYAQVVALREPVHLFDSPRDKWRKVYGSYVRELEWVYGELRQHFPTREYQDLVQDIMERAIRDWLSVAPPLEKLTRPRQQADGGQPSVQKPKGVARLALKALASVFRGPAGRWLLRNLNPAGFMVGPTEMRREDGNLVMFIPRCYMHTAPGDGRTQDQACVQGCKGACERVFSADTPVQMLFEPHLPDFSCTLRIKVGGIESSASP